MKYLNFFAFGSILNTWLCLIFLLSTGKMTSQVNPTSIDMRVAFISPAVISKGKPIVYYELHVTNFSNDSISLNDLKVIDINNKDVLFLSEREDLIERFSKQGFSITNNRMFLLPGHTGILYLDYEVFTREIDIEHQVTIRMGDQTYTSKGAKLKIPYPNTLILGPPLEGGPWIAIHSPLWERGHRRVYYTIDGKARIPGRFAIDFMKLDENGKTADGELNIVANWYGFNLNILAVSDGEIASVREDFQDSEELDSHPIYSSLEATGNYISLSIGDGNYVFYEHLKAGSIQVTSGQKVKKGDVIASLGFTGQATGPHLHFHVANKNSPLGAEGVPFMFEEFTVLGAYRDIQNFLDGKSWERKEVNKTSYYFNEWPYSNSIIKFPHLRRYRKSN